MKTNDWHVVVQGESIESIAHEARMLPDTLWNHPQNRTLREKRKDPHVLMPGDRIWIPAIQPKAQQAATGSKARFEVKKPTSQLKLTFLEGDEPRANVKYELVVDRVVKDGTTDGEGRIEVPVPLDAKEAVLTLGEGEEARTYTLRLRGLDPVAEVSGVQARLAALGYDVGGVDGKLGPWTDSAISAFQADEGLEANGKLDGGTRDRLRARYGC